MQLFRKCIVPFPVHQFETETSDEVLAKYLTWFSLAAVKNSLSRNFLKLLCQLTGVCQYLWLLRVKQEYDCNHSHCCLSPRWSGCAIIAGSSRRFWPNQATGLGSLLDLVLLSANHPCAKCPGIRSWDLAPKHPQALLVRSKTLGDQGPQLGQMLAHLVSHHETRKIKRQT